MSDSAALDFTRESPKARRARITASNRKKEVAITISSGRCNRNSDQGSGCRGEQVSTELIHRRQERAVHPPDTLSDLVNEAIKDATSKTNSLAAIGCNELTRQGGPLSSLS